MSTRVRVAILTGSALRHDFMRKAIALDSEVEVVLTFCEGLERTIRDVIDPAAADAETQYSHLDARDRSEQDFFKAFVALTPDHSKPVRIPKGTLNNPERLERLRAAKPDVVIGYGCSLVKPPMLAAFENRFVNLHLGLSPYYRGAGTNFWPLVNGEPEYVGATFMIMDAGIDTGPILHQIRARVFPGDGPHEIGNRLIADSAVVFRDVIRQFAGLGDAPALPPAAKELFYKRTDFSPDSVRRLYRAFEEGMIDTYLADQARRDAAAPIAKNPKIGA